ncbi:MAG: DUF3109 family protein [Balneolaceae bacterium]
MFRVGDTIISEDIATAKFACDVTRCKGACCVVGDSGAPVSKEEIPVLKKAYRELRGDLSDKAQELVDREGLIDGDSKNGFQIKCVDNRECVFVDHDEQGVAECTIQRAYKQNRFGWEKPVSCHLYPVRLKKIAGFEYANFEYIPELCSAGCDNGSEQGIYLSRFLEKALSRRYGDVWYKEFKEMCKELRKKKE